MEPPKENILKKILHRVFSRYYSLLARLDRLESRARIAEEALLVLHAKEEARSRAMNGQQGRKQILTQMFQAIPFAAIVETGTYLGATTRWLAEQSRKPVFSCEIDPWFHRVAKVQTQDLQTIELFLADCLDFLDQIHQKGLGAPLFYYLDAHWYLKLPLVEEVRKIRRAGRPCVVCIDDFQVPNDEGYGYNAYPGGHRLDLPYLAPSLADLKWQVLFPAIPSREETGSRRGCVFLGTPDISRGDLLACGLKPATGSPPGS